MDLQERLSYLETVRDWQSMVEELEKGISGGDANNAAKAQFHLRLGRVLELKFLAGVKALKHFQDAYKLNPALIEALENARAIYWDLGKLNMVQKLCELELKSVKDPLRASALLLELGDVLQDQGDYDKATGTYAKSVAQSGGGNTEASACLEDVQAESGSWQGHVAALLKQAADAINPELRSRLYLRAARVTRRFAPDQVEGLLEKAFRAMPTAKQAAALFEGMLVERGDVQRLASIQREVIEELPNPGERADLALTFGTRWVSRHQNVDVGSRFLEEALALDPSSEGAFHFLRDAYGKKAGDWDRVLRLAEEAATRAGENGNATFLLAQAGTIAWKNVGNLMRARSSFERLSAVSPEHPQLRAFEAQIGEQLKPKRGGDSIPVSMDSLAPPALVVKRSKNPSVAPPPVVEQPATPPAPAVVAKLVDEEVAPPTPEPPPVVEPAAVAPPVVAPPVVAKEETPPPAPVAAAPVKEETPAPAPVAAREETPAPAAAVAAAAPQAGDGAKIAELRALAEKQDAAKRYNEYVKTIVLLAGLVYDADEKIELYSKAADLYVNKFANQAEAVKAYEAILVVDPNHEASIGYLRQMYEKRRDWEKLLGLERREAERLDPGPERAAKFLEIAKLATERVKKPEVCIVLWQEVLDSDPSNVEALGALAGLYERSKEFDKLATVLEKQAELTYDAASKVVILSKLGTIYGDRLNNDEGAVTAFRALLALDPNDRKAQEAVKKKYLTLGRWDDLEVFYAERRR